MTTHYKTATIFGGTGFIGSQIVRNLAHAGYIVKIATRVPERAYFLKPCGSVGQIVPFLCNYNDADSIKQTVNGSDIVVNCIGILYEKRKNSFETAHVKIPSMIAKACKSQNVKRFVHISSLGVHGTSKYGKTKLEGEHAVQKEFPDVTILRPSVVFGPQDSFFNMFAEMARYMPCLPLIGGGKSKLQPVYVGDIADCVMAAAKIDQSSDNCPRGRIYELGGPQIVTFREIYEIMFKHTYRRRPLMVWPWWFAKLNAFFMGMLPKPPLTPDQIESLKSDNIVGEEALGMEDLGIQPTGMAQILPSYLARFRPGGRFAAQKAT